LNQFDLREFPILRFQMPKYEAVSAAVPSDTLVHVPLKSLLIPAIGVGAAVGVYMWQGFVVGGLREKYKIKVPATIGHPEFEKAFRAHQNTLEQLGSFIPSVALFSAFVSPRWAGALAGVWAIGRVLYHRGYVSDAPENRSIGMYITFGSNVVLWLGGMIGAIKYGLHEGGYLKKLGWK